MMPGFSRNWRRTSNTMAPAALVTALTARPENMNTTAEPMIRPTSTFGVNATKSALSKVEPTFASDCVMASLYDPNSAVAASTAVAIAMPLVMALVVLPTASSSVRICAASPSTSPDISAMPCALSLTGPNVSIATMTPTVVSRAQPASATANSATTTEPDSRNAPYTAAPITSAV